VIAAVEVEVVDDDALAAGNGPPDDALLARRLDLALLDVGAVQGPDALAAWFYEKDRTALRLDDLRQDGDIETQHGACIPDAPRLLDVPEALAQLGKARFQVTEFNHTARSLVYFVYCCKHY